MEVRILALFPAKSTDLVLKSSLTLSLIFIAVIDREPVKTVLDI